MSTPPPCALAILDSETYDLRQPPSPTSRLVRTARDHLLSDLDLPALSSDLSRISLLLSLSHKAALSTLDTPLTTQITTLSTKVQTLYKASASLLSLYIKSSQIVLNALPDTHSLLSQRYITAAINAFSQNDHLSDSLISAAASLSHNLSTAADDTLQAVESAQALRAARETRKHQLEDLSTEFRVRRAAAWHTHGAMLESLAEAGRLYERAANAERKASVKYMVFSLFGLVEKADAFLIARFGVPWLAGVRKFLESVRDDVMHAGGERRALLAAKRRQRELHRDALREVAECGGKLRELGGEVEGIETAIESLRAVAGELKRLSVVVMRMAAFWGQMRSNVGRLSSGEVVTLIRATSGGDKENRTEGEMKNGDDGEVDVREVEVWIPSLAVKRKIVGYYARWVALREVCGECLRDVVNAKEHAHRLVEDATSAVLAREVSKVTADLCDEMEKIDGDLDRYQIVFPIDGDEGNRA